MNPWTPAQGVDVEPRQGHPRGGSVGNGEDVFNDTGHVLPTIGGTGPSLPLRREGRGDNAARFPASPAPSIQSADDEVERGDGPSARVPSPRSLPRGITYRWCPKCRDRDRMHVHGVCCMARFHA